MNRKTHCQFNRRLEKSRSDLYFNLVSPTRKLKTIYLNKLMSNTFSSYHSTDLFNTKRLFKSLLPKINEKTSPLNLPIKPIRHYVLPEFKPQAQIIGEKLNVLNKEFINVGKRPANELNVESVYLKKKKRVFEMKQPHNSYDIYRKGFSALFSQIKKLNDAVLLY